SRADHQKRAGKAEADCAKHHHSRPLSQHQGSADDDEDWRGERDGRDVSQWAPAEGSKEADHGEKLEAGTQAVLAELVIGAQDLWAHRNPGQKDDRSEKGAKETNDEGMHRTVDHAYDHGIERRKSSRATREGDGCCRSIPAFGVLHARSPPQDGFAQSRKPSCVVDKLSICFLMLTSTKLRAGIFRR